MLRVKFLRQSWVCFILDNLEGFFSSLLFGFCIIYDALMSTMYFDSWAMGWHGNGNWIRGCTVVN